METDLYGHTQERNIGLKNCGEAGINELKKVSGDQVFEFPGQR